MHLHAGGRLHFAALHGNPEGGDSMTYRLFDEGLGLATERRGVFPQKGRLRICFDGISEGTLFVGDQKIPVKEGTAEVSVADLDGEEMLLKSASNARGRWQLEGLYAEKDGKILPRSMDTVPLMMSLYEENRKNRALLLKLRQDCRYFQSRIDGGNLF